MNYLEEGAE